MDKKSDLKLLGYCLSDFIETHYSSDRKIVLNLVRKLIHSQVGVPKLASLSCAALGHTLIIVQNGHRKKPKHVWLLNGQGESFHTLRGGRTGP